MKNIQSFGQTVVIAFNKFVGDTDEEIEALHYHCEQELGIGFAVNLAFTDGGEGAKELATLVADTVVNKPSKPLQFTYADTDSIESKVEAVAIGTYGAGSVTFSAAAKKAIKRISELGISHFPICIAKTQYSFSTDAKAYGPTEGYAFEVRDIVINTGAEMIVVIAGPILRMPGLPKLPQAIKIKLDENGEITGLS